MPKPIYVLNGPNLNLLGTREPEIYGSATLDDARDQATKLATELDIEVVFRQSNHEGEIVDWIQEARDQGSAIVINAGAYTHTSIAILDALLGAELPVIELHISNIYRRESFRHRSHISRAATGVICGLGISGYALAVRAAADLVDTSKTANG